MKDFPKGLRRLLLSCRFRPADLGQGSALERAAFAKDLRQLREASLGQPSAEQALLLMETIFAPQEDAEQTF